MKSLESVPVVLQLNERVPDFQKFPVMVKASEAEKNYLAKQASRKQRWLAILRVYMFVFRAKECRYVSTIHGT